MEHRTTSDGRGVGLGVLNKSIKSRLTLFLSILAQSWMVVSVWGMEAAVAMESDYRYVIVYNDVSNVAGDPKDRMRSLEILLDIESFDEVTLRDLFHKLSKRFSKEERLKVSVYTSLKQLRTPEEKDAGEVFDGNSRMPNGREGKYSFYWRFRKDEWFNWCDSPPCYEPPPRVILKK